MELWLAFVVTTDQTIFSRGVPKQLAYRTKDGVVSALKGHYGRTVEDNNDRVVFQLFTRLGTPSDSFIVVERQTIECHTKWADLTKYCS